jgi:hypothetical protein
VFAHQDTGNHTPDAVSSGRRALVRMALTHLCLAAQVSEDTRLARQTCSASRTQAI